MNQGKPSSLDGAGRVVKLDKGKREAGGEDPHPSMGPCLGQHGPSIERCQLRGVINAWHRMAEASGSSDSQASFPLDRPHREDCHGCTDVRTEPIMHTVLLTTEPGFNFTSRDPPSTKHSSTCRSTLTTPSVPIQYCTDTHGHPQKQPCTRVEHENRLTYV